MHKTLVKTMNSLIGFLSAISLVAVTFMLVPQIAYAGTTQIRAHVSTGVAPDNQYAVSPRLTLPNCSSQDGFNGNVHYDNQGLGSPDIYAWGQVWDLCGTNAEVFLSWNSPTHHDPEIGSSGFDRTSGVNYPRDNLTLNPSNIFITVCAWWVGNWTCGTPWKVP